jgi:hypothetical protein
VDDSRQISRQPAAFSEMNLTRRLRSLPLADVVRRKLWQSRGSDRMMPTGLQYPRFL